MAIQTLPSKFCNPSPNPGISHSANIFRKGRNPAILPPAIGKNKFILSSNIGIGTGPGEGTELIPVKH